MEIAEKLVQSLVLVALVHLSQKLEHLEFVAIHLCRMQPEQLLQHAQHLIMEPQHDGVFMHTAGPCCIKLSGKTIERALKSSHQYTFTSHHAALE